ncbi:MAG TPA: hypothetical protein VFQ57_07340 [Sphingomonas sp.]|jgi:hypothetical protein|nr:hypothetical protein [Sphingomonas sp.]
MTRTQMMTVPLLPFALALAACGSQDTAANALVANAAGGADYAARVRALAEGQRDAVLLRAIRDAGQPCQQVVRSTPSTDPAAWAASCDDNSQWLVVFNADGTATVSGAARR